MNDDEKLKEWLNTHDGEDYCKFCIYDNECPHGMTCYGEEHCGDYVDFVVFLIF